jgi:hypothetical protein
MIIQMAEAQSSHRRLLEQRQQEGELEGMRLQFVEARRGQICALIVALTFLSAGTYCIVSGHLWAGTGIGVPGLSGIVTAFIAGRNGKQQDDDAAEAPEPPEDRTNKPANQKQRAKK